MSSLMLLSSFIQSLCISSMLLQTACQCFIPCECAVLDESGLRYIYMLVLGCVCFLMIFIIICFIRINISVQLYKPLLEYKK